ncbi:MAG: manganese efflux pump MntP family protein [Treponema sp.]|nr:manganese efflux pump MntP family protein [Treponema sp.]
MLTWFLVALGLSADAFAVSVSNGICIPKIRPRFAIRAALFFGLFQLGMPILGWYAGGAINGLIARFDNWIAFIILAFIGGKMIKDSFGIAEVAECLDEEDARRTTVLGLRTLLVLSVATSLDALAVGLSYRMAGMPIVAPAIIIGSVTFIVSLLGIEFGKRIGSRLEGWAERLGGIVLIAISVKMLFA